MGTHMKLFKNAIDARWKALSDHQRGDYEVRADSINSVSNHADFTPITDPKLRFRSINIRKSALRKLKNEQKVLSAKFAAQTNTILGAVLIDPSKKHNRQLKIGDDLLLPDLSFIPKARENAVVAEALVRAKAIANMTPLQVMRRGVKFDFPVWDYSEPEPADFLEFILDFNNVLYTNLLIELSNLYD